jgi:hypothetical protein
VAGVNEFTGGHVRTTGTRFMMVAMAALLALAAGPATAKKKPKPPKDQVLPACVQPITKVTFKGVVYNFSGISRKGKEGTKKAGNGSVACPAGSYSPTYGPPTYSPAYGPAYGAPIAITVYKFKKINTKFAVAIIRAGRTRLFVKPGVCTTTGTAKKAQQKLLKCLEKASKPPKKPKKAAA